MILTSLIIIVALPCYNNALLFNQPTTLAKYNPPKNLSLIFNLSTPVTSSDYVTSTKTILAINTTFMSNQVTDVFSTDNNTESTASYEMSSSVQSGTFSTKRNIEQNVSQQTSNNPSNNVIVKSVIIKVKTVNVEKLVKTIIQSLGCSYVIGILGCIIFIFQLILRDYSFERLIHLAQELVLALGHIDLLLLCDRTDKQAVCFSSAVVCQFCFTAFFAFQAIEALYIYFYRAHFKDEDSSIILALVLGIGYAGTSTAIGVMLFSHEYPGPNSCWLNLSTNAAKCFYVPLIAVCSLVIILLEASSIDESHIHRIKSTYHQHVATINHGGLLVLLPSNLAAMILGQITLHFQHMALFAITFGINVANACLILTFHALGNHKFLMILRHMVRSVKRNSTLQHSPGTFELKKYQKF